MILIKPNCFQLLLPAVILLLLIGSLAPIHAQRYKKSVSTRNFTCQNKAFAFILNRLRAMPQNRNFINDFIKEKRIGNCNELFNVEAELDLNRDKTKEIILRAKNSPKGMFFCGATGNCSTWVLRRQRNQYDLIYDAGSIEEIEATNEYTRNYRNLRTKGNSGAMNHYLARATFNGKKYQIKECAEEILRLDGSKTSIRRKPLDCQ
jgi:hypothetical protein